MNITNFIKSLNLLYYEYDDNKKLLERDMNYTNRYSKLEFTKITYYLSKNNIPFKVLKNKNISFSEKNVMANFITSIKNFIDNKTQNIFLLNNKKFKGVKNIPLFKIVYIDKKIDFTDYDAIVFTSKNAIKAIDSFNKDWKNLPSYVISKQSGKLVKELNGNLKYISRTKHGNEFAEELVKQLNGKRVLYLRGKNIVSNLIKILKKNSIHCDDEIVYENNLNKSIENINIPKNSKIIFTSPSTINYFFKTFSWDQSYKAIVIGNTTAKFLPKNIKPFISDDTSFKLCIKKALEINS